MGKKGALSMVMDPDNPATSEYRDQMGELAGSLIPNEDRERGDNWLAFGAGLSSPGEQSGALSRALGAELKQRNESRALKAQYVPLVMTALTNQAQAAQTQKMNALLSNVNFVGMPAENVAALEQATGAKLRELWETANFGKNAAAGSFNNFVGGRRVQNPDVKTGMMVDENNNAVPIPGAAAISAQGEALKDYYSGIAKAQSEGQPTFQNNQPGIVPKAQALGLPGGPPIVPGGGLDGARGPVPPAAGVAPGVAPVQAPRGTPPAAPTAAIPPAGAAARPVVAPGTQAVRDNDAMAVLQSEVPKVLRYREEAIAALQQAQRSGNPQAIAEAQAAVERANGDVAALSRELQRLPGGKPIGSLTPPPATATASAPATTKPAGGAGFVPTGASGEQTAANKSLEALNEDWIKNSYRAAQDEAKRSGDVLTGVSVMRTALSGLGDNGTGWGAEQKKKATQVASALGMKNAKEIASNYEIFQSQVGQHLFDLLGAQKGPQTEGDAERAKETLVSLGKTRRANEFLIDLAQATAERNMKKASFYRDMMPVARETGNLSSVDKDWAEVAPSIFDSPVMRRWKPKGK